MEITVLSKDRIIAANMILLVSLAHDQCYKKINWALKTLTELIDEEELEPPLTISMLIEFIYGTCADESYLYSMDIDETFNNYINYYNVITGNFENKHITTSLSTTDAWTLKRISNDINSLANFKA
jgi:hypothetical protein